MISILALRALLFAAMATVQSVSVVSSGDQTQVLIDLEGQATYQHTVLEGPPRIVIDVASAELRLPRPRFEVDRGGVARIRSSQFQPGVVRVVIDLVEASDYQVERREETIVVSSPNPRGEFESWSSGGGGGNVSLASSSRPAARDADLLGHRAAPATSGTDRATTPVPVTPPPVVTAPAPATPRITVEFRNTPIDDVLGTFADFSARSIVPGSGVRTQAITATIQNQPWDEAMRAILAGQGLVARELPSGIIMVTSMEAQRLVETQEETITRAFSLQYVSADSVAPQVRELLAETEGRAVGTVAVNRATNTLIVSARQSVVDRLDGLLPALDRRTPQVTVKVRIMSVSRTRARDLGFRYELIDADARGVTRIGDERMIPVEPRISVGGNTIAAIGNATVQLQEPTFTAVASLLLQRHTLVAWLEAAQRLELAELQADPTITVLDHRTARIHVGERTPIRVVDPGAAGAEGPRAQVRIEETGVILELTPHVVGDQVLLNLHAERSFIQQFTPDGQFVFGTAETNTQILVDDGATAVISGLTTTDLRRTRSGIPVLMNIPFLGALFRFDSVQDQKEDLLIMVTPHIDRSPLL